MRQTERVAIAAGSLALLLGLGMATAGAQEAAGTAPPAPAAQSPAVSATPAADPAPSGDAQQQAAAPVAVSGCFVPPARLSDAEIDAFAARPASIFADYGSSNLSLANRVRSLAGSDGRALAPLIGLSKAANPQQVAAIGAGLGRAAAVCSRINPEYAQTIQKSVADQTSPEFQTAFVTASNDVQVAAFQGGGNGGAGAAAAGLAGGGLAGPGTAGLGGDDVVPTSVDEYPTSRGSISLDDGDNGGGTDGDISPSETM